jgi:hypothetical protein
MLVRKENPNWHKRANKKVLCAETIYEMIVKYDSEKLKLNQEIVKLNASILFWKDGWFEQRAETGKAAWAMPPEGYGRPSNEVNTMHIFDFKLEQPCSAEETKERIAKAKEIRKEYMTPVSEKKATKLELAKKRVELEAGKEYYMTPKSEVKPRVFGSAASLDFYKRLAECSAIDPFENEPQASRPTGKPIIKYDEWTTYLNRLRQK